MGIRFAVAVFLLALWAQCGIAQESVETCTLVGCESSADISIQLPDGKPPDFVVSVAVHGKVVTCQPTASAEWFVDGTDCGEGVSVVVREVVECVNTKMESDSPGWAKFRQDCPHTGRFEEYVRVRGDPSRVTVSLARQGSKAIARKFVPKYRLNYPNGRRCGDPCKYWRTTWTV